MGSKRQISKNGNDSQEINLNDKQILAVSCLIAGMNYQETGESVGITTRQLYRWVNDDPDFISELNRQRYEIIQANIDRVRSLVSKSLDVIERALDSNDITIALKGARMILDLRDLANYDQTRIRQSVHLIDPQEIKRKQETDLLFKSVTSY